KIRSFEDILRYPNDLYPLLKMKMTTMHAKKHIPSESHWGFCYTMLHKISRSFPLLIQGLHTDLRDAVCIYYLVLRALDIVEDDTSIATDVKIHILMDFYRHLYDTEWNSSFMSILYLTSGTNDHKVLMDEFHHTVFLELGNYQEVIEDITMMVGSVMAKFICKEIGIIDDYDEYCHNVAGLVGLRLLKLFHASGIKDLLSNTFFHSTSVPKSRMFWPPKIWRKYVDRLEVLL
ncbi:squalene synthase-like, partial [Olea europaea subsp. europaea]